MIPEGNDAIQDIALPFAQKTDGYGLLYSIMRQSLPWLTTNKGGWCQHEWKDDMSASKYASLIQQAASQSEVTTGVTRTELDMSMELLYQAIKSGIKADIAIGIRSRIESWQDLHPGEEKIPDAYKIKRIVDQFADFTRNSSTQSESSKINMMINKFEENYGKKQKDKKGFKYKNQVQCKACKMFGHDMNDDQICRSGAQHY